MAIFRLTIITYLTTVSLVTQSAIKGFEAGILIISDGGEFDNRVLETFRRNIIRIRKWKKKENLRMHWQTCLKVMFASEIMPHTRAYLVHQALDTIIKEVYVIDTRFIAYCRTFAEEPQCSDSETFHGFNIRILSECGRSFISHRQPRNWSEPYEGRIINGKQSLRGAWPWQVSLQLLHPKFGLIAHWCGAVLIQPLWILTAAHCIHNDLFNLPLASLWTAVLGEWDRNIEENTEIRVPIDKIIVHERFHNYQNDIAIMRLSRAVELRTICLPEEITKYNLYPEISKTFDPIPSQNMFYSFRNSSYETYNNRKGKRISNSGKTYGNNGLGWLSEQIRRISEKFQGNKKNSNFNAKHGERTSMECVATGWGRHNSQGPLMPTLLQATVPLHDNSLCQAKYGNSIPIQTGHLCAGRLDGTTGTCVGDSGGPLQCSLEDGRWVLAGLTSFGSGCARPGYPDVYTRLAFYVPWINNQINSYKDDLID